MSGVPKTYASNIQYAAHGPLSSMTMGNSVAESWSFNSRLQPISMQAGSLLTLGFAYPSSQNNNGNPSGQAITRGSGYWSQTFGYDTVNRLGSIEEDSAALQNYGYDGNGNWYLASYNNAQLAQPTAETPQSASWYLSNNQVSGWNYDNAGNLTGIPAIPKTFSYDAENRQTYANVGGAGGTTATYSYDADGHRVAKTVNGVTATYVNDAFGHLIAEYGGLPNPDNGLTTFYSVDHLGSTRLVSDSSGNPRYCYDYLPFGGDLLSGTNGRGNCYPSAPAAGVKFTGQERDAETGLDFFGARYFGGAQGRWTSPDRMNVTDDRLLSPSSTLNKYAYAANNPLRFKDLDGRDVVALLEPPHGIIPGHFMLFANNPENGQSAMMSFGPNDGSAGTHAILVFAGAVGSTAAFAWPKSADDLRQNYTALSIQTTPEQAQDVINFINRFSTTENPYALYSSNCTTVCRDALKAIGILPRSFGSITPFALWSNLFGRYGNPAKQRYRTTSRYGEVFQSLIIDTKQGTDYGNPQFGIDTFDFIMLMLQQPQQEQEQEQEQVTSKICFTDENGKQVCQ